MHICMYCIYSTPAKVTTHPLLYAGKIFGPFQTSSSMINIFCKSGSLSKYPLSDIPCPSGIDPTYVHVRIHPKPAFSCKSGFQINRSILTPNYGSSFINSLQVFHYNQDFLCSLSWYLFQNSRTVASFISIYLRSTSNLPIGRTINIHSHNNPFLKL